MSTDPAHAVAAPEGYPAQPGAAPNTSYAHPFASQSPEPVVVEDEVVEKIQTVVDEAEPSPNAKAIIEERIDDESSLVTEDEQSNETPVHLDESTAETKTCAYCGEEFPHPVNLHHSEEECLENQETQKESSNAETDTVAVTDDSQDDEQHRKNVERGKKAAATRAANKAAKEKAVDTEE